MEDRWVVDSPLDESLPATHLLAVFDGHRGPQAAGFCSGNLRRALWDCMEQESAPSCLKVAHVLTLLTSKADGLQAGNL